MSLSISILNSFINIRAFRSISGTAVVQEDGLTPIFLRFSLLDIGQDKHCNVTVICKFNFVRYSKLISDSIQRIYFQTWPSQQTGRKDSRQHRSRSRSNSGTKSKVRKLTFKIRVQFANRMRTLNQIKFLLHILLHYIVEKMPFLDIPNMVNLFWELRSLRFAETW